MFISRLYDPRDARDCTHIPQDSTLQMESPLHADRALQSSYASPRTRSQSGGAGKRRLWGLPGDLARALRFDDTKM